MFCEKNWVELKSSMSVSPAKDLVHLKGDEYGVFILIFGYILSFDKSVLDQETAACNQNCSRWDWNNPSFTICYS